ATDESPPNLAEEHRDATADDPTPARPDPAGRDGDGRDGGTDAGDAVGLERPGDLEPQPGAGRDAVPAAGRGPMVARRPPRPGPIRPAGRPAGRSGRAPGDAAGRGAEVADRHLPGPGRIGPQPPAGSGAGGGVAGG